ncbi:MAG: polyprenyl synthetase family protein, partial [Paracoccaceae bacterium]
MSFEDQLRATSVEIGTATINVLNQLPESEILHAMAHAMNGGKRLRGYLVIESAGLFGVPRTVTIQAAVAIECLHAYSLV